MGRHGFPPVPTAILKLRGSSLVKEREARGEPTPPLGHPPCPSWLTAMEKRHWSRTLPVLDEMGVLTLADGDALARYCVAYAAWRRARADVLELVKLKVSAKDRNGCERAAREALTQFERAGALFGLDPSSRARIHTKKTPKTDAAEDELFEKKA